MKIFAVYSKVELTTKPSFLDVLQNKYNNQYDLHITFKQPCYIKKEQTADVKNRLSKFFKTLKIQNHRISFIFDEIIEDDGNINNEFCLMLGSEKRNKTLDKLQKNIVSSLDGYDNFYEEETREYEKNFNPHITIASDLNKKEYLSIKENVKQGFVCKGFIQDVTLAIVKDVSLKEAKNPKNLTMFRL